MRRTVAITRQAMVIVAALATATACSAGDSSEPDVVTVTESATPENQAAGDEKASDAADAAQPAAAPATFDRNDPNFEFFNICEELTDEDLAPFELKFSETARNIDLTEPISSCGFEELEMGDAIEGSIVTMGGVSPGLFAERIRPLPTTEDSTLPGLIVGTPVSGASELTCDAGVPTKVGMLWVTYGYYRTNAISREEICDRAVKYLETIHSIVEKEI